MGKKICMLIRNAQKYWKCDALNYPELKGIVGSHQFGYNKKTHILHFVIYIPLSAVAAGICTLL